MADYVEALKRPFSDLTKLLIYIVISIIPIVNLISSGYLLDVAQTSMKRKKQLPDFKDYVRLFVEGVKVLIIEIIYAIPVIIALLISGVIGFGFKSGTVLGVGMVISIVLTLVIAYIATGAILRYADKRKLKEAFNFEKINKKIFTSKFFSGWLLAIVISVIIGVALSLIPMIGRILGAAIAGIFYMSVMGEVYSEA